MYKVFVVDDEPLVIRSLRASVNWDEYNFSVVGEAHNGIDAYEFIEKFKPDVVFTDIRMPGLNGLELIKKTKGIYPDIKFVVISAYAEFAYAQRALNYGAVGFCLKPFDDIEIVSILKKVKDTLDKSIGLFERNFLEIIEDNGVEEHEKLDKIIKNSLGFNSDEDISLLMLVSIGNKKLDFSNNIKFVSARIGRHKYVYLVNYNSLKVSIKEAIINQFSESTKGIGISNVINSDENIKKNIEKTSIAAYQFFVTGIRGVYEVREHNPEQFNSLIKRLEEVLSNRNMVLIQNMLDEIGEAFNKNIYNAKHAFIIYNIIVSYLYKMNSEYGKAYIYSIEQLLDLFDNSQDMIIYFKNTLSKFLNDNQQYACDKIKNCMFKVILKYINENFNNDISLQNISQMFTINPSYLSQLFKKEVGITFTEYLTKLRISFASNLLKTTDFTIGEISEKAGYIDYFYFTRTFKKVTGKTPSQYRNLNLK